VEKYCIAGEATDDNTVHAHCVLDNSGYRHTQNIQDVQLKSGPYFNISNLFTTCYITQIT
jgi:hypothetical protein